MKRFHQVILLCHLRLVSEEGQGLIEYLLLTILIAIALISVLTSLGVTLPTTFQLIIEQLQNDRQ